MPRKRELDPYVSAFIDRTGKERFRFRRGKVSIYLPPPGSAEYAGAYAKAKTGAGVMDHVKPGTISDLIARFYRTVPFRRVSPDWQRTMRQSIEPFREEFGDHLVSSFRPKDIDVIVAKRFEKRVVNGRKFGGSSSAERLREMLLRLFTLARKLEWIATNPVELSETTKHKGPGFYPWNEQDITAYRAKHPLGTKARLAMELMLWTGSRRSDAHMMPPPVNGRFVKDAAKTGKRIDLPVAPALAAALDAMPEGSTGADALIITQHGKPYTRNGLTHKMREWCDQAGLPQCTAHGLRKALTRRSAELGTSQQGLKALGQWSQDREVAIYAASANQKRLADDALAQVIEWERMANID